ncbi:MAG: S9 family peptidase, partial [Candidatus Bathyarchaeota archaeon]|nr:S9 family peptidase [Candidatus Bathyarchaeota archaeon]
MKRKVEAKDLMQIRYVSSPQISSDGRTVVFVHSKMDYEKDEYLSNIWKVDVEGEISQLSFRGCSNTSPRWAPNEKRILFTSTLNADGKSSSQLFTIPVSGGEAKQLTNVEGGVLSPRWSPDGKKILFISSFR